jgi:hypothetical protein
MDLEDLGLGRLLILLLVPRARHLAWHVWELKQTSYIARLGVTVFDFRLFWGSEPLGHVRPTLIKFDPYRPTFILFMDWATLFDV